mgnify:CR=1 FL=1
MFKYTIGSKEFKSKFGSDVSLFSINPPCLKILSEDHYFAYNGFNPDYKESNLFDVASKHISIKVEKIDGRLQACKGLKYVSVIKLLEALKDNESFKSEMMNILKGE